MPNNINKTIKINVDSSDLAKLRDLVKQIETLPKSKRTQAEHAYESELNRQTNEAIARLKQRQSEVSFWQASPSIGEMYKHTYAQRMSDLQSRYTSAYKSMLMNQPGAEQEVASIGKDIATAQVIDGLITAGAKLLEGAQELTKTVTGMNLSIKDTYMSILSNAGQMMSLYTGAATYSTGTSLITNRAARSLQLQYGLSGSQAYGLQTAGSLLGMNVTSMEDFAYMNPAQRALFTQYLEKYTNWHDKMENSGLLNSIQQMQLDFAVFKQDMAADFLSWIAQNKETILVALKGILEFIKGTTMVLGKLATLFGVKYDMANLSGEAGTVYNNGKNVTATMNVTMSGVADQTEMRALMKDYINEFASDLAVQIG